MGRLDIYRAVAHPGPAMTLFLAIDRLLDRLKWVAYVVILLGALSFAGFALDRKPPFAVLSVDPAFVQAGEVVTITAKVWRDQRRTCSAEFARFIYDSDGRRFDLGASYATAQMIADQERKTPGVLRVSLVVPMGTPPGPAALVTGLAYKCNRTHQWAPIEVTTTMPFTVLP